MSSCSICCHDFSWDASTFDKSRLPVQSQKCPHSFCYACVCAVHAQAQAQHAAFQKMDIPCPICRIEGSFVPSQPIFNLLACELLEELHTLKKAKSISFVPDDPCKQNENNGGQQEEQSSQQQKPENICKKLNNYLARRLPLTTTLLQDQQHQEPFLSEAIISQRPLIDRLVMIPEMCTVHIEGAGTSCIAGMYNMTGYFQGSPTFSKLGEYRGWSCQFTLFHQRRGGRWFLSGIPVGSQPRASIQDVYLYSAPGSSEEEAVGSASSGNSHVNLNIPLTGWMAICEGLDPPPLLNVIE